MAKLKQKNKEIENQSFYLLSVIKQFEEQEKEVNHKMLEFGKQSEQFKV